MSRHFRWIDRVVLLAIICATSWFGWWCVTDALATSKRCETTTCYRQALAWNVRERHRLQRELARGSARYAIHLAATVYGISESNMRTIAQCESGMGAQKTAEAGSGASGLFQFLPSTFARTPFAHFDVFDPVANALAAGWLVRKDGGWREWSCSSITGVR